MDITKSIYIGSDYSKELVIPKGTAISLEDMGRAVEILLERSKHNA